MKIFYTDPLQAAYMAKEFGYGFDIFMKDNGPRIRKHCFDPKILKMFKSDAYEFQLCETYHWTLQPQADDSILLDDGEICQVYKLNDGQKLWVKSIEGDKVVAYPISMTQEIVRRFEKHFFMPTRIK